MKALAWLAVAAGVLVMAAGTAVMGIAMAVQDWWVFVGSLVLVGTGFAIAAAASRRT